MRARGSEEGGAVLVMVAVCLVFFLALLAYTIDLGAGRQAQQRVQVAADAGALVAANALGQGTTGAALTTLAVNMATTNAPGSYVTVETSPGVVTVSVSNSNADSFASPNGARTTPVMALAVATPGTAVVTTTGSSTSTNTGTVTNTITGTVTNTTTGTVTNTTTGTVTSTACPTAGNGCLAIYASGTSCGGDSTETSDPVVFGGGVSITGGVWSDGSLDLGGGGSTFGPLTYATGCHVSPDGGTTPPQYKQNSSTFNGGYPVAATPLSTWPINYATDFPACSGSSCTGPCATGAGSCGKTIHTPDWCSKASTATSWSIDTYNSPYTLVTGQIYCAVGSGSANTPSSWNGALTISGGGNPLQSTFVAASIKINGGTTLTGACGYGASGYTASNCSSAPPAPATANYPLFYATSGTIDDSAGGTNFTGDWFAPKGTITVGGGTGFVGFLQAPTVNLSGGIRGDGPASSGGTIGSTTTTTSTSLSTTTGTTTSLTSSTSTSLTYSYSSTTTTGTSTTTTGSNLSG